MRKVDAAAFEYGTVFDQPGNAAAAFGPRPRVAAESAAVERFERSDERRLQVDEIASDGVDVGHVGRREESCLPHIFLSQETQRLHEAERKQRHDG